MGVKTRRSTSPPSGSITPSSWAKVCQIGSGAFGCVHTCININDGSFFATKQIHLGSVPPQQSSRAGVQALAQEMEILKNLRHPNVVEYSGAELDTDGNVSIAMELVCGGDLAHILEDLGQGFSTGVIQRYTRWISCTAPATCTPTMSRTATSKVPTSCSRLRASAS